MIWGYKVGAGGRPPVPIKLEVADYCHALITGASGSGKAMRSCIWKEHFYKAIQKQKYTSVILRTQRILRL